MESEYSDKVSKSKAFPFLTLSLIPELIKQSLIVGETAVFRQFREQVKQDFSNYN